MSKKKDVPEKKDLPEKKERKIQFNKPSSFGEKWVGKSPEDMVPGIDRDEMAKYAEKDLFDVNIGIFGYIELSTKFKGEDKPFALCNCCVEDNTDELFTVVSSGTVILKKLRQIGEKNGFPIMAKFVRPEGKEYFNLVDVD